MRRRRLKVNCPAKLNLCFDIIALRTDGYHDIETLFQSIDLEDELLLTVEEAGEYEFELLCSTPFVAKLIPLNCDNLIWKAAEAFFKAVGKKPKWKLSIQLNKQIPVAAGLAGGSSDAAGIILALNYLLNEPLSLPDLLQLGGSIGSDVPFCLSGGTAIGRGRGEVLEQVENKLDLTVCAIKPRKLSISTPFAFKVYDEESKFKELKRPNLEPACQGLAEGNMEMAVGGFGNVFESLMMAKYPQLEQLKQKIEDCSVWHCQMTGSGPTLFAICSGREMAQAIRRRVLNDEESGFYYGSSEASLEFGPEIDFRICQFINRGPVLSEE